MAAFVMTAGLYPAPVTATKADVEPVPVAPAPAPTDIAETRLVHVTAYTSAPEETDDTPFTTASGQTVRDGIVATNLLPFGTKIRIPKYFGERVFEVQDRMNVRGPEVGPSLRKEKSRLARGFSF